MALKVWLPFDGDLRNLGCSGVEVTNNGATINDSGKIGKCYSFNGSNNYLLGSPAPLSNESNEWSFCCWFKPNSSHQGTLFCNRTTVNSTGIMVLYYGSTFIIDSGGRWQPSASAVQINQWNHIAVTIKKNTGMFLYLNGILLYSTTTTYTPTIANSTHFTIGGSQSSNTSATGNFFNGYINDIRIYDHCLSAAEVHEISQGLILHYKLDDITNRIVDSSGYGHHGAITGNITTSIATPRYSACNNFSDSACSIGIGNLSTLIPAGIFTFNIWFKKITDEWSSKNYETILGGPSGFELEAKVGGTNSPVLKYYSWGGGTTNYTLDEWHMLTMVRTTANTQFYLDGELKVTGSAGSIPSGDYFIGAWKTATAQNYRGYLSDARIYCTPLLDTDIKMLYNIGMKVDNLGGIHTFQFKESNSKELIQGIQLTNGFNNHNEDSNPYLNYNNDGDITLTGSSSVGSTYIPISPSNKTYYYDIEVSIDVNNQFYFGFERYDINKTSRSNNACTYVIAIKPTSGLLHQRYFGTVNLATDGVNPCAFIAVRILNDWSNASGRGSIIHKMSLREVTTLQNQKILKSGTILTEEFNEHYKSSFYKNGFIETANLIEI